MAKRPSERSGLQLRSESGLTVEFNANGSLRRFDCRDISLLLFLGTEIEGGPANVYLRCAGKNPRWTPLLGPASPTRFELDASSQSLIGVGSWLGIDYVIELRLAAREAAWFWHVELRNTTGAALQVDLTYAQDLALASYGAVRMNEYYVSQYVDHTPLPHAAHGWTVASRQNQAVDGKFPWCLIGSLRKAEAFGTDALQFYGLAHRSDRSPAAMSGELSVTRLQHEHSMSLIRDRRIDLAAGATVAAGFFGRFVADHPAASSPRDLDTLAELLSLPESAGPRTAGPRTARPLRKRAVPDPIDGTLFSSLDPLPVNDLDKKSLRARFAGPWRHEEKDSRGRMLSFFFAEDRHVVLRAKERRVLRPHGHLLRTGRHLTPDESSLTSTVWMAGIFHSMVTQGHVSINRFLSTSRSYLGMFRAQGLRVFAELNGEWRLLDQPSAFEMSPAACRWIYCHDKGEIEVRSGVEEALQALTLAIKVTSGTPMRFLVCCHVALDGDDGARLGPALWKRSRGEVAVTAPADSDVGRRFPDGSFRVAATGATKFDQVGGDELLFLDGRSRRQPYLCLVSARSKALELRIRGTLIDERSQTPLRAAAATGLRPTLVIAAPPMPGHFESVARIADIVPWFAHNALVHYLAPRGLEQFSGGGWGTRDVCQGPVEMLLALGRPEPIRDLLLRVMRMQNQDGDWPQWFMFFERERNIRPGDSHGDIVFWPLVVLAQYLLLSGDASVLEASVPFFDDRGPAHGEAATLWQHAQRALALIERRVIPGTALAAYGHGDWNDSLQPADHSLRERMCSAWTVTLNVQMLLTLARALRSVGRGPAAEPLEARARLIRKDFQRWLVVDGVLTGYAIFDAKDSVRYLLHPRDHSTGVQYSSLAMIHAILEDLLSPAQIDAHLDLIDQHLHAADGVRLFDRPMSYQGGRQRLFQRAETATFFGREIGLMYMHAHLRYAQALAHLGKAERFFRALAQANPIAIQSTVAAAALRQANCYYSSSDAAFADRYEARAEYARVAAGTVALEGGWRVYSSGAGIALGLIFRHFLGFRIEATDVLIDPVMPAELDGLKVRVDLLDYEFEVEYQVGARGCGVSHVDLNGIRLSFEHDANPHRRGAARVPIGAMIPILTNGHNRLLIDLD